MAGRLGYYKAKDIYHNTIEETYYRIRYEDKFNELRKSSNYNKKIETVANKIIDRLSGKTKSEIDSALDNLANILRAKGYNKKIESVVEKIVDDENIDDVDSTLYDLGRVLNAKGYSKKIESVVEKIVDKENLNHVGSAFRRLGDILYAKEYNEKVGSIVEKIVDEYSWYMDNFKALAGLLNSGWYTDDIIPIAEKIADKGVGVESNLEILTDIIQMDTFQYNKKVLLPIIAEIVEKNGDLGSIEAVLKRSDFNPKMLDKWLVKKIIEFGSYEYYYWKKKDAIYFVLEYFNFKLARRVLDNHKELREITKIVNNVSEDIDKKEQGRYFNAIEKIVSNPLFGEKELATLFRIVNYTEGEAMWNTLERFESDLAYHGKKEHIPIHVNLKIISISPNDSEIKVTRISLSK